MKNTPKSTKCTIYAVCDRTLLDCTVFVCDCLWVFNLGDEFLQIKKNFTTGEKSYDCKHFHNRVERFYIDDHNVPTLVYDYILEKNCLITIFKLSPRRN